MAVREVEWAMTCAGTPGRIRPPTWIFAQNFDRATNIACYAGMIEGLAFADAVGGIASAFMGTSFSHVSGPPLFPHHRQRFCKSGAGPAFAPLRVGVCGVRK